jgi:hypothetical protein
LKPRRPWAACNKINLDLFWLKDESLLNSEEPLQPGQADRILEVEVMALCAGTRW